MRLRAVLVVTVCLLSLAAASALSPAAASAPAQHPSVPASAATLAASASPGSVVVGGNVQLVLTLSGYNYTACGSGSLNWQLTNGATFLNPFTQTVTGDGTYTYVWASQAPTGTWTLTGELSSECPLVSTANGAAIVVSSGSGGGIALPSWLYQFLADTYHAAVTALDQGIAAPIASVLGTIADAFALLLEPWGSALASLGVLGPVGLSAAVLAMSAAVYGVLAGLGEAKALLGY